MRDPSPCTGYPSLEDFLKTLSAGRRNTIERYIISIGSHFQSLVEEVIYLHENLPPVISRLKGIRDELDCWHRGANCVILGGSSVSALSGVMLLYAILIAPATAGTSLAAVARTLSGLGAFTSIGSILLNNIIVVKVVTASYKI